ncbi:PcfJ domain-containing protein [bacterium]|nr:PcfJ domain-containing protein [bacterium]
MLSRLQRRRLRRLAERKDQLRKEERERRQSQRRYTIARTPPPPVDPLLKYGIDTKDRSSRARLYRIVAARHPALLERRQRSSFLDELAQVPWHRSPETWRPRHRSVEPAAKELVRHLLALYPVPAVLVHAALDMTSRSFGDTTSGLVPMKLLSWLGGGRSLRDAAFRLPWPYPLTRRMTRTVLRTTPARGLSTAVVWAVIRSCGGDSRLADQIEEECGLWLWNNPQQFFEVCRWLSRHGPFTDDEVEMLTDEIDTQWDENPAWSLRGRTPASIRTIRESRKLKERLEAQDCPDRFPASGLKAMTWESEAWGEMHPTVWTMQEILTLRRLADEGRGMHHCVATYCHEASEGRVSLWSLRRNGRRRLTVQVNHEDLGDRDQAAIVWNAAGPCNRDPRPDELHHLRLWTEENGLAPYRFVPSED